MQGGDLGEHNRQLVDAIRNVRTLSQLWLAVNGHDPYWRVVLAATVTEACTLIDLIYGAPAASPNHDQVSLLELLERDEPRSPAIPLLRLARQSLDSNALDDVRELRNRVGAHVDEQLSVSQITQRMQNFDAGHLNAVIDHGLDALTNAARADRLLSPVMLFDAALKGLLPCRPSRASPPVRLADLPWARYESRCPACPVATPVRTPVPKRPSHSAARRSRVCSS